MAKPLPNLSAQLPRSIRQQGIYLPDQSRSMGTRIVAGKGAGKSRLAGRMITYSDLLRGVPQVILDPVGGLSNNLLDKLWRLPEPTQSEVGTRLRWYDMAGTSNRIMPLPLLYRRGNESFFAMVERYNKVILRIDPDLKRASIYGWNAFEPLSFATGSLLAAMGYQYTEAMHLVQNREAWRTRIEAVVGQHPELTGQAHYLYEDLPKQDSREWEGKTSAFLTKMRPLEWNQQARAMYGSSRSLDFAEIEREGQTVILDFRSETSATEKRFKLLWCFQMIFEYIMSRPTSREQSPFAFVIDEIMYLLGEDTADDLAQDLEELINLYARNKSVWLTILHQEKNQVSERVARSLESMGIQFYGVTSDPDAALETARRFYDWEPDKLKKTEPMYTTVQGVTEVIDYRTSEYSIQEQEYLNSREFLRMKKLTFQLGISPDEGETPKRLQRISIASIDPGQFVDEPVVDEMRRRLMYWYGVGKDAALTDIASRTPIHVEPPPERQVAPRRPVPPIGRSK